MAKPDVITSITAGVLELTAMFLAFGSFWELRPDMFPLSNVTADSGHRRRLMPYASAFACASALLLGNAALLDLWFPLVRGHGSGVSKYVSWPVNILKIITAGMLVAWAVPCITISTFFADSRNSTTSLCGLAPTQCSRAASVAVEASAGCVIFLVCIVAYACGSCRVCPGHRKKFTNSMILASVGPLKNFGWLVGLVLGVAGLATQLLLAWQATDDDLSVNATVESAESWTEQPWVVRGMALATAGLVLFAILCDIMSVALAADRVQNLTTSRVAITAWILKATALVTSILCASLVSVDYSQWDNEACDADDAECKSAAGTALFAWISVLLLDLFFVSFWLHSQHMAFRAETEQQSKLRHQNQHGTDEYGSDLYGELAEDEAEAEGNMILNAAHDPGHDIITVGADGRIYTGGGTV